MPLTIDITQYELYQEDKAEGKAEEKVKTIKEMLCIGTISLTEISKISGFSLEKIIEIRDQLGRE
jgi:hypothetical protein